MIAQVGSLDSGMSVLLLDGSTVAIQEVSRKGETARVYNFSVDGLETYFVGEDGVLVHNCSKNSHFKKAELPVRGGKVRYLPPKNWKPSNPLPRGKQNGYLDKFGNEWRKRAFKD
ncbi:MAG: polymorphic toxin type 17 domain-containing protein [Sumerlaeia bacterium]